MCTTSASHINQFPIRAHPARPRVCANVRNPSLAGGVCGGSWGGAVRAVVLAGDESAAA